MEVGLDFLADRLNVPPHQPSWDAKLKKIEIAQETLPPRDHTGLHEARANLRAVQVAWRNPTRHVEKVYTEEVATDILNAVKGFMRHLATL
jgi:hypothetical protein